MKSMILFPYTFVLLNWAAVLGLYHFLRGQHDVWSGYATVVSPPLLDRLPVDSDDTECSDAA